jgi:hypothetical protein
MEFAPGSTPTSELAAQQLGERKILMSFNRYFNFLVALTAAGEPI